nr:nucleotidyl transferase AbiEii/AbiGii toxin family protein [uncultured Carboxylicivirga sp.]
MNTSNQSYKELAIPYFKETFECIDKIMKAHKIPYYLIGVSAIALELLKKGIKPSRGTKDIDFAIMISSMAEYERISDALIENGYNKVKAPWTFYSDKFNVAIDILPFGEIEEQDTINFNKRYSDLHVLGFTEVLEEAVSIPIEEKMVNIPPLPGMIILKLVAWSDRPEERDNDLADILKIIEHYFDIEFDDIVENHNDIFPDDDFDQMKIAAEVLGRKAGVFLNKSETLSQRIHSVLKENLSDASMSAIAREWSRKLDVEIEYAYSVLESFYKGILEGK